MASKYEKDARDTYATLAKEGGTVTLFDVTPRTYDEDTRQWSGGDPVVATQPAMQLEDDPKRFEARNLRVTDPLTLFIAAWQIGIVPAPLKTLQWGSRVATIKDVEPLNIDGLQDISYTVVAGV